VIRDEDESDEVEKRESPEADPTVRSVLDAFDGELV
jgi:hypothetical protein